MKPLLASIKQRPVICSGVVWCGCCGCGCCCLINAKNQARGRRTGYSHSRVEEYATKQITQTKSGTRIYQIIAGARRTFATETDRSEIGSQRMRVSGSCWYIRSSLAAETDYTALYQGKERANPKRKKSVKEEKKKKGKTRGIENEARKVTRQQRGLSEVKAGDTVL